MPGPVGMALNLVACVGPVIGGWVAYQDQNHEWVFWMLVIVEAMLLLSVGAILPETAGSLVGNGRGDRGRRRNWWEQAWWGMIKRK